MRSKPIFIFLFFVTCSNLLFSQITISEIQKNEETIVLKPLPYDSLANWYYDSEKLSNLRMYIGIDVYLPPIPKTSKGTSPYIINKNGYYCDSTTVSNTYFTIIDVIYGEKLTSNTGNSWFERIYFDKLRKDHSSLNKPLFIFLLKNNKTNDSLYCFYPFRGYGINPNSKFILVPYFVKQKNLYQNQTLIYDDYYNKFGFGRYYNETLKVFDERFVIKSENDNGIEKKTFKEVIVEPGSIWTCSEVTLLKRTHEYYSMFSYEYEIYYILNNKKGEQITLDNLHGFINEMDYLKRKNDKKLEEQELLAKEKEEERLKVEAEKNAKEKHKKECINLFGQQNGELIMEGKVKIGMSKEMCQYSWGKPFWKSKTTTEAGIYEDWYYGLGYSLHFENDLLKIISE